MKLPKYTRWEHERRFLVLPESIASFANQTYWKIEDKYFEWGRLRLRSITESESGKKTFKLCKKFESDAIISVPIVNIYLSEIEYQELDQLRGIRLVKRRYHEAFMGHTFGIDVFAGELAGLVMCEVESDSEMALRKIVFPKYAEREVTLNPFFTGGNLCQITGIELRAAIQKALSV